MVLLEVERKFHSLAKCPLLIDSGYPPFKTLRSLRPRSFRDIYYDDAHSLSSAGVWLRQREGKWQAKIRKGGNYTNSQFEEVSDLHQIREHVHRLTGRSQSVSSCFGLRPIADFTTFRDAWTADDHFKIVMDRTDFGHVVGEVELEKDVVVHHERETAAVMAEMDEEIVAFMDRYRWAFTEGVPKGKLTAFFTRQGHDSTQRLR